MKKPNAEVVTFQERFRADYKALNIEWIQKYFTVEEKDIAQLDAPEKCIEGGGQIFFTVVNGRALGTCAMYKIGPTRFELAKMAVSPEARGLGLGNLLMEAAERWAHTQNATEIMLQSNTVLIPAITLYRKHGYKEVDVATPSEYARCNIEMIKPLI